MVFAGHCHHPALPRQLFFNRVVSPYRCGEGTLHLITRHGPRRPRKRVRRTRQAPPCPCSRAAFIVTQIQLCHTALHTWGQCSEQREESLRADKGGPPAKGAYVPASHGVQLPSCGPLDPAGHLRGRGRSQRLVDKGHLPENVNPGEAAQLARGCGVARLRCRDGGEQQEQQREKRSSLHHV